MKKFPLHRVDEKKSLHFSALFYKILVERRKIMMEKFFFMPLEENMQKKTFSFTQAEKFSIWTLL